MCVEIGHLLEGYVQKILHYNMMSVIGMNVDQGMSKNYVHLYHDRK